MKSKKSKSNRGPFSRQGFAMITQMFAYNDVKPEELIKAFNYYDNLLASGAGEEMSVAEAAKEIRRDVFNNPCMGSCVNEWVRFFKNNYFLLKDKKL